ncbi:hypothetical protein [Alloyangia pacifica]|uniref:hypothetical protein n=1 Tax=Alloyangia pacifica TaxID=311180 RepID=UPI001CFD6A0F|nr:hypothetical protein [Alloyangia pacifica]
MQNAVGETADLVTVQRDHGVWGNKKRSGSHMVALREQVNEAELVAALSERDVPTNNCSQTMGIFSVC